MSIADSFECFCTNIKILQSSVVSIRERYMQITRRINLDYYGIDSCERNSLYVGSYGRDTEIHTSDIDILVILPYEVYERFNRYSTNGQSALLQEVKEVIKKTYSMTHMRADGQVIGLSFSDGVTFEIVPCFNNRDNCTFTYPDTNNGGKWKVTNPRAEINEVANVNNNCNKNLKRLCRMLRAWKEQNEVQINGLLIDTLASKFLSQWKYRLKSYLYYDFMSRDCFKYIMNQNPNQSYWYAIGSHQLVYNQANFIHKAKRAYEKCLEAIEDHGNKHYWLATSEWRMVYGSKFPDIMS